MKRSCPSSNTSAGSSNEPLPNTPFRHISRHHQKAFSLKTAVTSPGAAKRATAIVPRVSSREWSLLDERCLTIGLVVTLAVCVLGFCYSVNPERVVIMSAVFGGLAYVCSIPLYWDVDTGNRRWVNPAVVISAAFALYYGIGDVPCSLWAYDKMSVQNPGSYDYYPLAGLYATGCLVAFLWGYRKAVIAGHVSPWRKTWSMTPLQFVYWCYLALLLGVTYALVAEQFPKIVASALNEFVPTAYILLFVLGFAIYAQGRLSVSRKYSVIIYTTSIAVPFFFFILCNRRFLVLATVVVQFLLSKHTGFKWKRSYYMMSFLGLVLAYLTTTIGLRQPLTDQGSDEKEISYNDVLVNLKRLPEAISTTLTFSSSVKDRTVDAFQVDSSYRLAGLEEIAGIFAGKARGDGHFLLGRCSYIGVLKMIPHIVWPSKPIIGWGEGSTMDNEKLTMIKTFQLTAKDQLATPITSAYADYNWFGALICMGAAGFLSGWICVRLHRGQITARSLLLVAPYSFSFFIFFERNLVHWIVHPLRNLVITYVLVLILDGFCSVAPGNGTAGKRKPCGLASERLRVPKPSVE